MACKAFPQELVGGRVVWSTSHLRKPRSTPAGEGATPGPSEPGEQRGWGAVGGQPPSARNVKQGPCVSKQVDSESHSRAVGLCWQWGGVGPSWWSVLDLPLGLWSLPLLT